MQSLKKSNSKLLIILILCVAVLAVMLGLLYVWHNATVQKGKEVVVEVKKKTVAFKKNVNCNGYVVVDHSTPLYQRNNDRFVQKGMVRKDTLLLLDENNTKETDYYQLANSEYYIFFADIKENVQNKQYDDSYVRYLVFNENAKTKDVTNLYDQEGNLRYSLASGIDLPIYKKEKDMYFVVYFNELLGIKKSEAQVYAKSNTHLSNANKIPVLMYHFFYDEKAKEVGRDGNFVEITNFKAQMQYAKDHGFQSIPMKDVDMYLDGVIQLPPGSFVVSMDDNAESVKRLAYPVLEQLQIYATNFVITSWTDDFASLQSKYVELQSHSDNMHQGGCSGMQHGGLFNCIPYDDGLKDVTRSKEKLNGAFVFCYPFGDVNENMKKVLRDGGYRLAFTTKFGYVTLGMDKLQLPRVRITKSTTMQAFASLLEG